MGENWVEEFLNSIKGELSPNALEEVGKTLSEFNRTHGALGFGPEVQEISQICRNCMRKDSSNPENFEQIQQYHVQLRSEIRNSGATPEVIQNYIEKLHQCTRYKLKE